MHRLSFGPLFCLLRLQTLPLAAFHGAVMQMRLFVILAARAAEKEQNRLSVGTAHAASLRRWRLVVTRSTLSSGGISPWGASMLGDFLTYIEAVIGVWFTGYWFLTALPEALSYVLPSALLEKMVARLDRWASPETRQYFYRWLFISGIFIAGFLAWDEQYQIAISKSSETLVAKSYDATKSIRCGEG
jgi:hypothetical protein